MILELPGFAAAAAGAPQDRLAALRAAKTTSYFKDKDTPVGQAGGRGCGPPKALSS
ncbi:MAG: hypothetical protein WDN45_02985 [Caulobacteraceae bacterium]